MSDPFDRDKPLTIFDRLRIHEHTAEDRDALLAELEEEHEALKERHEVLQALLRGRLAGDEDVPAPMKAGDRIPPSVAFVLDLVADLVDSTPEAKNYVQLAWTNGATGKDYELTVRYADGEMPAARAARLEKARDDARRDLARIYAECGEDTDGNDPEEPAGWVHLHPYALQAVKGLRTEVDEVRALADTYIDIVNRTARALGIPEVDEDGAMPSLHDVPERVAEVVRERHEAVTAMAMAGVRGSGLHSIAVERARQVQSEGWTPAHDDEHGTGDMARAGAIYAMPPEHREMVTMSTADPFTGPTRGDTVWQEPKLWPWDPEWWKPCPDDRRRELVKAGALIVAEIDRLDRAVEEPTDDDATQDPPGWGVCGKVIPGSRRAEGPVRVERLCMDVPGHDGPCRFDARANTGGPA